MVRGYHRPGLPAGPERIRPVPADNTFSGDLAEVHVLATMRSSSPARREGYAPADRPPPFRLCLDPLTYDPSHEPTDQDHWAPLESLWVSEITGGPEAADHRVGTQAGSEPPTVRSREALGSDAPAAPADRGDSRSPGMASAQEPRSREPAAFDHWERDTPGDPEAPARSQRQSGTIGAAPQETSADGPYIEQRRSFQTWQVLIMGIGVLLLGMAVGYSGKPRIANLTAKPRFFDRSSTATSTAPSTKTRPGATASIPPVASTRLPASAPVGRTTATTTPATTTPATTTPATTTPTSSPTTPTSTSAPQQLLLLKGTGSQQSDHFKVSGPGWAIGWAYDCSLQGGTGSFVIKVVNTDGAATTDGSVVQNGAGARSVTVERSTGDHYLDVSTACRWAVKVTGVP